MRKPTEFDCKEHGWTHDFIKCHICEDAARIAKARLPEQLQSQLTQALEKLKVAEEAISEACHILVNNSKGSHRGENAGSINAEAYSYLREALSKIKEMG